MESERQFSSPTESGLFMSRKERGAIAAQACETCRNRKQKCSEGRPKCSSCEKLQTPCVYRSPPITKKDRTLLHILERLKSVESKIDGLSAKERPGSAYTTPAPIFSEADIVSLPSTSATSPSQSNPSSCYRYVSSVSQMVEWPKIRQLIENLETSPILDGLSMRQSIQCAKKGLPFDRVQAISMSPDGTLNVNLPFTELEYGTTSVNWDSIQRLSKAFFDTYNFMHPLLDREAFNSTIHNVIGCGFGDDTRSILAFLVLALGEVALAISSGFSVLVDKNHSSNLEGFTSDRPPGLAYFNEARKRMGFVMAEVSLENVQMFSLAALYYDSCGRYAESRRLAATASLACQSLVMSKLEESNQHHANLLRRNFWHCCIMELSWHMELDIPTTGLDKLGNAVGLPELAPLVPGENYVGNQMPSFQNQFISEVVLHRLSASFHSTLTSAFASSLSNQLSASPPAADSPYTILKQLAGQLEQWRAMLPEFLQWRDDQSLTLTDPNQFVMFTLSMGSPTASYSYTGDIQIALFRTRYYYNKYLLYRPFVFKALHYPLSVTSEDAQGAANCLLASLRWPIAMSPPCLSKRLLPLTALWSQNLFGVLVLLYLSSHHPVLARIRTNYCGQQFEFEATDTIEMYTDWLRDMKKTDPGAERCWSVVKELFQVGM